MSFRILLVDPDSLAAAASERALIQTGYAVVKVHTFEEATRQMSLDYPDLLVTKARLGSFNGLHLLLRCRAEQPDLPVIIVGTSADRTADVTRFGAEFVTSPVEPASLLEVVATLLSGRTPGRPVSLRREPTRDAHRKRAVSAAAVSDHSARAVESRCPEESQQRELLPAMAGAPDDTQLPIAISLPTLGLSTTDVSGARCHLARVNPDEGAEMALPGWDFSRQWRWAIRPWRGTVDSLN